MPKKSFPAKLEYLTQALVFITDRAKAIGFEDKTINQIKLASEEVLVNIINYAYPDKEGNIEISYILNDNKSLKIEIVDWGVAFDPLSLPEPDINAPLEDREIGGLGVYLVRNIMDEVNYKREEDRNILTFVKY